MTGATGLKIVGVTANCGNDTIGSHATQQIVDQLTDADVVVVNCQEVDFDKTKQALLACLKNRDPACALVDNGYMRTLTKPGTLMHPTGIATFVLYREDKVTSIAPFTEVAAKVRGKNWNKGGFLNTFVVTPKPSTQAADATARAQTSPPLYASTPANPATDSRIFLRTCSAHLDASKRTRRIQDWLNLRKATAIVARDFDALAAQIPDVSVSGYDANTRNRKDPSGKEIKPWEAAAAGSDVSYDPESAPLLWAPQGAQLFSAADTYRTGLDKKAGLPNDPKRKGYFKGGSLDFVAVDDATQAQADTAEDDQRTPPPYHYQEAESLGEEAHETKRDHNVLISSLIQLSTLPSPFARVKFHLINQLKHCAPLLASELSSLEDSPANRTLLFNLYQHYLGPNGEVINQLSHMVENAAHADEQEKRLTPWFAKRSIYAPDLETFQKTVTCLKESMQTIRTTTADRHMQNVTKNTHTAVSTAASAPRSRGHATPAAAATLNELDRCISTLIEKLTAAKDTYLTDGSVYTSDPKNRCQKFYKTCNDALQAARPTLCKHRSRVPILNRVLDLIDAFLQGVFGCTVLQTAEAKQLDTFGKSFKTTYNPMFFATTAEPKTPAPEPSRGVERPKK